MTHWEFTYWIFNLKTALGSLVGFASSLLTSCFTAFLFYCSCVCIYQFIRLLCSPIVGFSLYSGASDAVKASRNKRDPSSRGGFVPGQRQLR